MKGCWRGEQRRPSWAGREGSVRVWVCAGRQMGMIWKDKAEWEGFQCEGSGLHKGSETEKHRGYSRGCEEPASDTKGIQVLPFYSGA